MGFYPVVLEMAGRRCVVVGGGVVAEGKVDGLLNAGGNVKVISRTLTVRLQKLADSGTIVHERRSYRPGDLEGCHLVFAATNDPQVNRAVHEEGKTRGLWVNAADDPARCSFFLPSVLRRGDLAVAVSTGGKSPALAKSIRQELENYFTKEYVVLVHTAAGVREDLRRLGLSPGYDVWRKALNGAAREYLRRGDAAEARRRLLQDLGAIACE